MTRYTPETGIPEFMVFDELPFDDDDTFELSNGVRFTGAQLKQWMEIRRNSGIGKAMLAHERGEGPAPESLMTLVEYTDGEQHAFLGDSDVDITDLDPNAQILLDEVLPTSES